MKLSQIYKNKIYFDGTSEEYISKVFMGCANPLKFINEMEKVIQHFWVTGEPTDVTEDFFESYERRYQSCFKNKK